MNQENILYIQILMSLCLLNVQTLKLYACWFEENEMLCKPYAFVS